MSGNRPDDVTAARVNHGRLRLRSVANENHVAEHQRVRAHGPKQLDDVLVGQFERGKIQSLDVDMWLGRVAGITDLSDDLPRCYTVPTSTLMLPSRRWASMR